jgi:hypothetical protein
MGWKLWFSGRQGRGERRGGAQKIVRYFEPLEFLLARGIGGKLSRQSAALVVGGFPRENAKGQIVKGIAIHIFLSQIGV